MRILQNKYMIIMRGPPGYGKSTKAKKIAEKFHKEHGHCAYFIASTDDYFLDKNEHYNFDGSKLAFAHEWNHGRVQAAAYLGCPLIIVDNTSIKKWHYQHYVDIAKQYDYTIYQCACVDHYYGSAHDVPEQVIENMRRNFQPDKLIPNYNVEV